MTVITGKPRPGEARTAPPRHGLSIFYLLRLWSSPNYFFSFARRDARDALYLRLRRVVRFFRHSGNSWYSRLLIERKPLCCAGTPSLRPASSLHRSDAYPRTSRAPTECPWTAGSSSGKLSLDRRRCPTPPGPKAVAPMVRWSRRTVGTTCRVLRIRPAGSSTCGRNSCRRVLTSVHVSEVRVANGRRPSPTSFLCGLLCFCSSTAASGRSRTCRCGRWTGPTNASFFRIGWPRSRYTCSGSGSRSAPAWPEPTTLSSRRAAVTEKPPVGTRSGPGSDPAHAVDVQPGTRFIDQFVTRGEIKMVARRWPFVAGPRPKPRPVQKETDATSPARPAWNGPSGSYYVRKTPVGTR